MSSRSTRGGNAVVDEGAPSVPLSLAELRLQPVSAKATAIATHRQHQTKAEDGKRRLRFVGSFNAGPTARAEWICARSVA